ncbi:MAG: hypothetical protein HYY51_02415 [Candidatus Magasanikbacteria bacterium]|nr:hypothetical protein [Candidatus Magasanikbacteria bacterium]
MSFLYQKGEKDNLLKYAKTAFEAALGKEGTDVEVKNDHLSIKQDGSQKKCYPWPKNIFAKFKAVDVESMEDWDVTASDGGTLCFPESLLNSEAKYYYTYTLPNGSSGWVIPEVACKGSTFVVPDEPEKGAGDGVGGGTGDGSGGGFGSGGGVAGISRLNKLGGITFNVLIGKMIKAALSILGTIALIMFMYGGFVYMTSGGSAEDTKKAWNILIWGALGVIVILASYALSGLIFGALS